MKNDNQQAIDATAQTMLADARHYVESVAAMAETAELSAAQDIVSSTGIKLIARGARIDASLREKLRGHRLSGMSLEKSLAVAGGVTPETLAINMSRLIEEDAWFKSLAARSGDPGAMRHGAARLDLPREILFRLTVAREQRPALYLHSIRVAVICHYLGLRLPLRAAGIDNLVIAALCHDLGELFIDPAILDTEHRIAEEERRYIDVHPIVSWLMVCDLPGMPAEAASAILQHQERLDGSGYPYGRKEDALGLPGRMLAAADLAASIVARFKNRHRLSTLLRLNRNRYDAKATNLLHEATRHDAPESGHLEHEAVMKRLSGFVAILDGWGQLRAAREIGPNILGDFLPTRMFNLRSLVVQFGFDPYNLATPLQLAAEDPAIAAELNAVLDELQFQLADLGREFDRRTATLMTTLDPLAASALTDWRRQLQECIGA